MNNPEILILGAGSFGTCLAQHLAQKELNVILLANSNQVSDSINKQHINKKYFPDITLEKRISATSCVNTIDFDQIEYIINATPTQYTRAVYEKLKSKVSDRTIFINASKGIENKSLSLPLEIIKEVFGEKTYDRSCVLSGPSFAIEVLKRLPTAVSIGGRNKETLKKAQKLFHTPFFRTYANPDPIGLEISGALKNVIAIAVGALEGLGLEQNTKAALITRGLGEIKRLGLALGADAATFQSLGGMGDLILTCSSQKSRNFRVGYHMGQGCNLQEATILAKTTAEGVSTSKSAYNLATKLKVDAPICEQVYLVLHEKKPIKDAFEYLLNREMKSEF